MESIHNAYTIYIHNDVYIHNLYTIYTQSSYVITYEAFL